MIGDAFQYTLLNYPYCRHITIEHEPMAWLIQMLTVSKAKDTVTENSKNLLNIN